jgi:hypothetical protein
MAVISLAALRKCHLAKVACHCAVFFLVAGKIT